MNKHCISETEETIPFFDCFLVRIQDMFASCESGYEHNKRGLRKMEVCDQAVQDLKLVSRVDEDLGPAASSL